MNLDPLPPRLDGVREMKVKIPVRLHVSLHGLKLLSGRQISDIVTEAVQQYLASQVPSAYADPPHAQPEAQTAD